MTAISGVMAGLSGPAGPDVVVVDVPRHVAPLPSWGGWLTEGFAGRLVVVLLADAGLVGLASLAATAPWVHELPWRAGGAATVILRGDAVTPGLLTDIEDAVELPVSAVIGHDRVVLRDLERGRPPAARARADDGATPGWVPAGGRRARRGAGGEVGAAVRRRGRGGSLPPPGRGSGGGVMTEPVVQSRVWDEIRQGRSPNPQVVASVAAAEQAVLGVRGATSVASEIAASVLGAGPLEPVLGWPGLTDVAVNADGTVWADTGHGMRRTDVSVGDPRACRSLAQRLAGLAGKRLDEATAYVDGVLPTGVRLHAILPAASARRHPHHLADPGCETAAAGRSRGVGDGCSPSGPVSCAR
ncbi:MAG: hypothetical protein V9F04_16785 [Dermatophilaceae bacterium]